MGYISSPLSEVIGFTVPLVSPTVAGHFETDVISIVDHAFGVDFITNDTRIRHTLALHMSSVVALLTDTNEVDGFILYIDNLVVVDIGLVVAPRGDVDIADVDNRQRFID